MRVIAIALLALGCGGTTSPSSAPADAGPARVPAVHRSTAVACPTTRPPGSTMIVSGGSCSTDADCTAGKNGRCVTWLPAPSTCSYDECFVDGDCGSGVCDCRSESAPGAPNRCFKGTCRVDADCGTGYCSPSGVNIPAGCEGPPIGSFGFFCHTSADECIDDADCPTTMGLTRCAFDPERLHFRCFDLSCVL